MTVLRSRRFQLLAAFSAILIAGLVATTVLPQGRGQRGSNRFADRERVAIAEPFVGISADGKIEPGLFSIHSTGVSTKPVLDATLAFLDGLNESQRKQAQFPVDDPEWRRWANQHSLPRQGISFEDLDEAQRESAFALMKVGLSAKGFQRSRDIMRLNYTLAEITSNFEELTSGSTTSRSWANRQPTSLGAGNLTGIT